MSAVVIAGDTSGSVTLQAPSVAGTTTLTLPSTSGTVVTTNTMPTGSVLQVVSATTTTSTTTTSTSYVDTNLSASITPTSSSNKILVIVTGNITVQDLGTVYGDAFTNITRGSTEITATRAAINFGSTTWNDYIVNNPLSYLDSPSTTSSTTYKVRISTSNATVIYPYTAATITLMEIKG